MLRIERDRATFVPHDPTHKGTCLDHRRNDEGCVCNLCDTPWPCDIRNQQRELLQAAVKVLKIAGWDRTEPMPNDLACGMRWANEAGWSIFLAYGEGTAWAAVRNPDGEPWASTTAISLAWLDDKLSEGRDNAK